jgi:hypothetical protein
VSKLCRCACCTSQLEPAQQLRFLVETENLDNPAFLARIRMLPSINGKPMPVCHACQTKIEATPRPVASGRVSPPLAKNQVKAPLSLAVGLLGVLSVGVLLGALINSRG